MAASDSVLGTLHEKVAVALAEQVDGYTVVEDEVEKVIRPSPALLSAAIAFLKNNNITADPNENTELTNLSKALSARRKNRASVSQAALDEAADAYANSQEMRLQ